MFRVGEKHSVKCTLGHVQVAVAGGFLFLHGPANDLCEPFRYLEVAMPTQVHVHCNTTVNDGYVSTNIKKQQVQEMYTGV